MIQLDDYVLDDLMRDPVGHDRRPATYLVYVWLAAEQQRRKQPVGISYSELAESTGLSKTSAQAAVSWLVRRRMLSVTKPNVTAPHSYMIPTPWKVDYRHRTKS